MDTQHVGDFQESGDAGVRGACLDGLVGGPAEVGGQVDALLGAVVVESGDADAVADGAELSREPLVVGQGRHSTNGLPKMIISQPGLSGIFRS